MPIPKVIYQTWKTKELPASCVRVREKIQSLNPNYEMKLFDDEDMRQFIEAHFEPFIYHCYLQLNVGAAKADFWRYCVLYKNGGIYLDMDSDILRPLDELILENDQCIITREGNAGSFNNWIMIYQKDHTILWNAIQKCCRNIAGKTTNDVCLLTGPAGPYTEAINDTLLPWYPGTETNLYFENDELLNARLNHSNLITRCRFYGFDMESFAKWKHAFTDDLYAGHMYWRDESTVFKDIPITEWLKVHEYPQKMRLGAKQDGGYVVAELKGEYDCYISAGVSDEESFSRDFLNLKQNTNLNEFNSFAFDGTIASYPHQYTRQISFVKKNIGTVNAENTTNLSALTDKYNSIFLKMDIESFEVSWILSLTETQLQSFKQIVIEFHGILDDSWNVSRTDKEKALEKMAKTHYLVHAHGNNFGYFINNIPTVIELTYVNKSYFDSKPPLNTQRLPIPGVDFPNATDRPDYPLHGYPFSIQGNIS